MSLAYTERLPRTSSGNRLRSQSGSRSGAAAWWVSHAKALTLKTKSSGVRATQSSLLRTDGGA